MIIELRLCLRNTFLEVPLWKARSVKVVTESEAIQIIISFAGIAIAAALAYVAYSSLQTAKKDRQLRLLDAKLQKAFHPIYEILRNARYSSSRETATGIIMISGSERKIIESIVRKYGYYLEPKLLSSIQKYITEPKSSQLERGAEIYFLPESEIDPVYETLRKRVKELTEKLEKLG